MEYEKKNIKNDYINIENFSKKLGEKINIGTSIIKDYILASISIGLASNIEVRTTIDFLYNEDKINYYNTLINSTTINHVLMKQGDLEEEIYARKVLGLLLVAEFDFKLRNVLIKILRKYNWAVFNSVKKVDKKRLIDKYSKMDEITRETEAKLDSALYFYITIYKSPDWVDEGFITAIMDDILNFEFDSLISTDIDKELTIYKEKIDSIKKAITEKYGEVNSYRDFINFFKEYDKNRLLGINNLFKINKLDMHYFFKNDEFNIDKVLLPYIRNDNILQKPEEVLIDSVIIHLLIKKYKQSKNIYFRDNEEVLYFKLNDLERNINCVLDENKRLKEEREKLQEYKIQSENTLHNESSKLIKEHNFEISCLNNKIKELEKNLEEEKNYKMELNALRKYVFEMENDYTPQYENSSLDELVENKKIIIIGGAKEWRRKFREKYPSIRSLNGLNENFDVSVLNKVDYVFFFTGHMNHATYYKTMNFIRVNQIPFGYIGKTNIELVEQELINELENIN